MTNKHITIATTFRDFNGSINDQIQMMFLASLSRQTFTNFTLVVTLFREKRVQEIIEKQNIHTTFFQSDSLEGKKFCLSEVVLNGQLVAATKRSDLMLWTTCDVIFSHNFLEICLKEAGTNGMITSHPHLKYRTGGNYGIDSGFDLIGFGQHIFLLDDFVQDLKTFLFNDWGVFEHFLVALGSKFGAQPKNLFFLTQIEKIENDRAPGRETSDWMFRCWRRNKKVFVKFLRANGESPYFMDLIYCHMHFLTPGRSFLFVLKNWKQLVFGSLLELKWKYKQILPKWGDKGEA